MGFVRHACVRDYINNMRLFQRHNSILVVTADPSRFIR